MSGRLKGYVGQDARAGVLVTFCNRDTGVALLSAQAAEAVNRGDLVVMKNGKVWLDREEEETPTPEVRP